MANRSRPQQENLYGFASPTSPQFPAPIVAQRAPTTLDTGYVIGQQWIDQPNDDIYILSSVSSGSATWVPLGGQASLFPVTPFVVGPMGQAGYQTIQSAVNAAGAAGGGMVFVQAGTYVENLTLQFNVIIIGASNDPSGLTTVIAGVHTPPTVGTVGFQNITLLSSSDIIASNAAGNANIFITLCDLIVNGFVYDLPNWDATTLSIYNCNGTLSNDNSIVNCAGTTLTLNIDDCFLGTAFVAAQFSGFLNVTNSTISTDWNFNDTASVVFENSNNTGMLTFNTNSTANMSNSVFSHVTNPIVQSSASPLTFNMCTIDGSVNPISGVGGGIVSLGGAAFPTSNVIPAAISTSTNTVVRSDAGYVTSAPYGSFFAYLAATVPNATGAGAFYQLGSDPLTVLYDFQTGFPTNGVFTAPMTGVYRFTAQIYVTATTIASQFLMELITTSVTHVDVFQRVAGGFDQVLHINVDVYMTVGDTAFARIVVTGEALNTDSIAGNGVNQLVTYFSGHLVV